MIREPGWERLLDRVGEASAAGVGAPTLAEAGIVLSSRMGIEGKRLLALLVMETELAVIPFGDAHWKAATDAQRRYGKGRHRAALNFGDCLTYAVAKLADQPVLCTGSDFSRTDLATV